MEIPEYLMLFSNKGDIRVEVEFINHKSKIINSKMISSEITKLIDPQTHQFYTEMRFDEKPFKIYRYTIDPIKKKIIIVAK